MKSCIQLMKQTLIDFTTGRAQQVLRTAIPLEDGNVLGLMPAVIPGQKIAGAKIISIFPQNSGFGLPSHQGVVVVFETSTGKLHALVDGEAITAIRTAAVSAVASDLLARENAQTLAIIGSGLQARKHLEALTMVREIKSVFVWDIDNDSAKNYASEMREKYLLPIQVCPTSQQAIKEADIICTVTSAKEPVIFGQDIKEGAHINAVGACLPGARELDSATLARGRIYADSLVSFMNEAGDFLIPFSLGIVTKEIIVGELGAALAGNISGRQNDDEITIFESLGLAIYDLAAAHFVISQVFP
ncbi:MAG: ornithine cyclodeaminase family protein [Firmicutes bacterium]|nr:ornithine cyclodeaminase family protein [Bacillota bacterium]